ncbi:hypothetical protein Tco_0073223 [Tanacetum coccineum]
MASEERAGLTDRIRRLGRENLRVRALLCIERDRVDSLRHHMALSQEEFCQIRRDRDDARRRLRILQSFIERPLANYEATHAANALEAESQSQNGNDGENGNGGNGNGNHKDGGNNKNGNLNENGRGAMPVARVCTYQDFMKCQPLNFKGTEGVVGLTRWFEKMETLLHISNCPEVYQVKYATCTLLDSALTWWNSHKRTVGVDAAFAMTWRDNNNLAAYTQRFQELTLLYTRMVPGEEDRIERYVGGLPDNIQGNVMSAEPTRLQDAIRFANTRGKAYTIGGGDANPGSNVVTGTFLLNNHYASVLFDLGADRSFMSTTFSTLLDIIPDTLDVNHPFNIDLMPVELGSFNVIIGMDWLANNHAVIVCDEKIVRIPFGDEILIVQGDRSDKGKKSTLSIISCTKTQKYMKKGCQVFLAQFTKKETKVKSKEKRLEDVPIVRRFLEVFPEDLPGLPPA